MKITSFLRLFDHWTLLALAASFGLISLLVPGWTSACFNHLAQPLLWLLVGLTLWEARRLRVPEGLRFAILSAALGVAIVALTVQSDFRVLSDEANLVGVSRSMLYDGTPEIPLQSRWSFDRFWTLETLVPKRPLLFPFLLTQVHRLVGYHYQNGFYLNLALLFALLTLVYLCGNAVLGKWGGISLQLLFLAQPILELSATSAGFDLLSTLVFLVLTFALYDFFKNPEDASFLLITLLWFANTRYESILAIPIVFFFLWRKGHLNRDLFEKNKTLWVCAPLLLYPRIWQHALTWKTEGAFSPVGFEALWQNSKTLILNAFTDSLPYARMLNAAALLLGFYYMTQKRRAFRKRLSHPAVFVPLTLFVVEQIVRLSVQGVSYSDPNTFRLFLGLSLALSALFFFTLKELKTPAPAILLLAFIAWANYHPVAMENRAYRSMDSLFETKLVNEFLDKQQTQRVLVISDRPGNYTIREVGSVDFDFANRNMALLLRELSDHLYENIFIVQRIPYKGGSETTKLAENAELEPVFEYQTRLDTHLRISRVQIIPQVEEAPEQQVSQSTN